MGVPHRGVSITNREEQEKVFGEVFSLVTKDPREGGIDIGFALDDADFYMSGAGRAYGSDALAAIVKLGREAGLSQIFVAQGSAAVSKDLISNSNLVLYFRTSEPNLLDYARWYMRDIEDIEHLISNLPEHTCLVYTPNGSPKVKGFGKVVGGRIVWTDLPPLDDNPEADGSSPEDPGDTVESAASSSPPENPPDTATSTDPSTSGASPGPVEPGPT